MAKYEVKVQRTSKKGAVSNQYFTVDASSESEAELLAEAKFRNSNSAYKDDRLQAVSVKEL